MESTESSDEEEDESWEEEEGPRHADQQKTQIQGRDDSIKQFGAQLHPTYL